MDWEFKKLVLHHRESAKLCCGQKGGSVTQSQVSRTNIEAGNFRFRWKCLDTYGVYGSSHSVKLFCVKWWLFRRDWIKKTEKTYWMVNSYRGLGLRVMWLQCDDCSCSIAVLSVGPAHKSVPPSAGAGVRAAWGHLPWLFYRHHHLSFSEESTASSLGPHFCGSFFLCILYLNKWDRYLHGDSLWNHRRCFSFLLFLWRFLCLPLLILLGSIMIRSF